MRKKKNMHAEKRLKGISINETFIQLGDYGIVAHVFLRFLLF